MLHFLTIIKHRINGTCVVRAFGALPVLCDSDVPNTNKLVRRLVCLFVRGKSGLLLLLYCADTDWLTISTRRCLSALLKVLCVYSATVATHFRAFFQPLDIFKSFCSSMEMTLEPSHPLHHACFWWTCSRSGPKCLWKTIAPYHAR